MRTSAAHLVLSASACHRRGNRPRGVDGCAPVWELMDETSNTCWDNMNVTWWLSDVTIWPLCVDFVVDATGILYAVQIVAGFYTVQYEHMKRDAVAWALVLVQNFLEYIAAKIGKIGWHLTKLQQIWKGWLFSETQCGLHYITYY